MNRIEIGKFAYEEAVKMGADGPIMQDTSEEGKRHAYEVLGEILESSQNQMQEAAQKVYLGVYLLYTYMGVCKETDKIIQDITTRARLEAQFVELEINGRHIDSSDFGDQYDNMPEEAEPYCCADMRFNPKDSTQEILEKYSITQDEYNEICEELAEKLSFGSCGWCL